MSRGSPLSMQVGIILANVDGKRREEEEICGRMKEKRGGRRGPWTASFLPCSYGASSSSQVRHFWIFLK